MEPQLALFDIDAYTFGQKDYQPEEDPSVQARMQRLSEEFKASGMRRSVEAVMLVEKHGHPHILAFQVGGAFFKLPGDQLLDGEDVADGLKRILNYRLSPNGVKMEWPVADLLSTWWRPNFDTSMYPYLPPHIKHPKEEKKVLLVQLPKSVPKNLKLVALPLFEIYENQQRYGPMIASIPHLVSRFKFQLEDKS